MPRSSQHHVTTPEVRSSVINVTDSISLILDGSRLNPEQQLGVLLGIVSGLVAISDVDPLLVLSHMAGGLSRGVEMRKVMKVREKNRLKIAKRRARLKGQKKTAVTPVKKSRPRARRKKKR